MNVSAPDLLDEDSKWDEQWLEQHLIYSTVFNDAGVREAMQKHHKRFQEKGVFSALYEMGSSNGQPT
jgi:hypothetical protein